MQIITLTLSKDVKTDIIISDLIKLHIFQDKFNMNRIRVGLEVARHINISRGEVKKKD